MPPAPPACQPGDVDDSGDDLAVAAERHESEKWDLEKDALDEKEVAVAVMDHYAKAAEESRQGRQTSIRKAGKAGKHRSAG